MPTKPLTAEQSLTLAIKELQALSEKEYNNKELSEILKSVRRRNHRSILQYNRLLGIILKKEFAKSYKLPFPSERTGARRGWIWESEKIRADNADQTWQYQVLKNLAKEHYETKKDPTTDQLCEFIYKVGETEGELINDLFESLHKHICGNKEAASKIDEAIKEAKKLGVDLINPTPQKLIPLAGVEVCRAIMKSVPEGMFLGPLAGGITILLLNISLDVFCGWIHKKVILLKAEERSEQDTIRSKRKK